ncbi:MAG: Ig-like domain-containing protein, partial [Isosphaeraceae bacterium]
MIQHLWDHARSTRRHHAASRRRTAMKPEILRLEERLNLSTTLGAAFLGDSGTGWYPPDTNLAAGPNDVVESVNEAIAIYNKSTGALVSSESLPSLFSGFDSGGGSGMFDPSVMYDSQAGRFVVVAQVDDSSNHKSYVDLAVSNSSDPTQGFTERQQIEVDEGGNYWVDNGKLGGNADAYVFTGNLYTFSGAYAQELVLTVDKSSVLDQNSATLTDYLVNRSGNFSMIPARMQGSASGGPMWFVETNWSGGSSIDVVKMTNVDTANPSFTDYNLPVNSYSNNTSPIQPGGTVGIVDSRTLNVEWNNNYLVAGFDSASGSDAAAAWVQFNTSGANPQLTQQGLIHPASGVQTYFPAVSVDSSGDMGMTYMESSSTEYVSMYITGRLASDPANTMEPATLVKAGAATLNPSRAGDYGGLVLDPSTANTFWAGNEYAQSNGSWGTWITQFTVGTNSNSQPPTVTSPASASPNPVTGTTTNLSVQATDSGGASSLTYNWAVTSQPSGVPAPSFSTNGTGAAQNTTATFYAAGSYTFAVTITDTSSLSVTSSVALTVDQTETSISVSPGSVILSPGATQQFTATALDQFGNAMASQPTFAWSVGTGGGTISSIGLYTAPSATGTATIQATAGSMSGAASVTVANAPAAPSNLTATAVSRSQVNLSWINNATDQTGFIIERS